jgi:hypothetical protein
MNDTDKGVNLEEAGEDKGGGKKKRRWQDMTPKQKRRFGVRGAIQMALMVWTLRDISRRDASQIKGSKRLWTLFAFVQPVGPIAYLIFGRKR